MICFQKLNFINLKVVLTHVPHLKCNPVITLISSYFTNGTFHKNQNNKSGISHVTSFRNMGRTNASTLSLISLFSQESQYYLLSLTVINIIVRNIKYYIIPLQHTEKCVHVQLTCTMCFQANGGLQAKSATLLHTVMLSGVE